MSYYIVDALPRLTDVECAIASIEAAGEEGPRLRTCLRLLVLGMRSGAVAALLPRDFDLPASAVLRSLPGLKVTVSVRLKRGSAHRIRLEGPAAQDAKDLLRASAEAKTPLFTVQSVRHARQTLGVQLGRPLSAFTLRLMALAKYEAISLLVKPHERGTEE